MVDKISPNINEIYFIEEFTLFHILSGTGTIQVDFETYLDWQDKLIFLEKGQYIKFLSDDFVVRRIVFDNEKYYRNSNFRVLFKHLVSLGYINFEECSDCQNYLTNTVFNKDLEQILDISTNQWYWQNPFQAEKEEYQLIFDVKEVIDTEFRNQLTGQDLVSLLNESSLDYNAQLLVKQKIGLSIKDLQANKIILEGKKELAFTDKPVQEIAYDLGYKDAAYFNRVFKNKQGVTPRKFRELFDYDKRDLFSQDLIELVRLHHKSEHQLAFYADKMNVTVKTLSNKLKQKMNLSIGQLIRLELINSAKKMILEGAAIVEISRMLGFEEPNHFSTFFKHYTQCTPTQFKEKVQ